jgi:L-rhamnose mutarotase
MARHVLTLDLRDDPAVVAAYRRYHAEAWPEVVESIRGAGVREMDIHILGRRLVMILEIAEGVELADVFQRRASVNPKVAEWEQLMKSFQQPAPDAPGDQWWAVMERVFSLPAADLPGSATLARTARLP